MTSAPAHSSARPAGPRGNPLTGVLGDIRRDSLGFMADTFRRYGDVSAYRIGPLRSHMIAHPDGVKHVLQEHVKNYTKDHFSYTIVRWLGGDGLLTSQGDSWLHQRRLAQPAFHRQRIAAMSDAMVAATAAMLDGWQAYAASGRSFDVGEEMMALAMRIVGEALFGTNVQAQTQVVGRAFNLLSAQIVGRFRTFNIIPPVLPTAMDRAFRRAIAELDGVIYQIIGARRQSGDDHGDLLSMLMLARDEETGAQMSDRQLRDECLTMLVAGHETTATVLTWAWALLDRHPQALDRLQAELGDVLGGRAPTVSDIPRLSYTRMVIDEAMRLYPPVYVLSRKVLADDEIGGYRIPAGSSVDISPYVTHRHPAFWERPDAFEPERFSPDQVAARHKYAYIPFSTGPRMCIGNSFALMETTIILAMVAQRYRLRVAPGHVVRPAPLVTLRPDGGLPVFAEALA
jgi:cytochrome P450